MKKGWITAAIIVISFSFLALSTSAQCSLCTRTAQQLGEKPAKSLNAAIIYLMLVPFGIMGYLGYRWWQSEKE